MLWDPQIGHLVQLLRIEDSSEDFDFDEIIKLVCLDEVNALLKIHNVILHCNQDLCPCVSTSCGIALEVMEEVRPLALMIEECRELYTILTTPHFRSILAAHDIVAQRDYVARLGIHPIEVDEDEDTMKLVQLVKTEDMVHTSSSAEPMVGATIRTDEETGRIVIARIMHGGAADRSGLIAVGDEVVEVNGVCVTGKSPSDVLDLLRAAKTTVTFKLIPNNTKRSQKESRIRLKALFDYNPENDGQIPCKEAGLGFKKGDILHIVSQDDYLWWQARKDEDRKTGTGLIPSRGLQEKRILKQRDDMMKVQGGSESEDYDREDVPTYSEVSRLYPRMGQFRPVVFIGAPGVKRDELVANVVAQDPHRFTKIIPHTSRPPKCGEIHGLDYFFDTKEQMQEDFSISHYVEYGQYNGNLYGTKITSILESMQSLKQPIISPHHQALKLLRTRELKPIVIFIKPPDLSTLRASQSRPISHWPDDEYISIVKMTERLEFLYGHLFDFSFRNNLDEECVDHLCNTIYRFDQDVQWVPLEWVQ